MQRRWKQVEYMEYAAGTVNLRSKSVFPDARRR